MKKAISTKQRIEYVLKSDDSDPKTIFVLKPLSGVEMIELSGFIKDGQLQLNTENITSMLKKSIVEIKNYEISNIEEAIKSLDVSDITELFMKVGEINNLTESDKKKS
ncbi:MAG: hypothetical protein EOM19_06840 [Candidatus Moranbacteria bacterium]|nr:hypothetical protein [Candidatus Moranbacteria bacterium]